MSIDQDSSRTGNYGRLGENQGVAVGGDDFRGEIQPFKLFGDPFGGLNHVGLAFRVGTYAGNAKELAKLFFKVQGVFFQILVYCGHVNTSIAGRKLYKITYHSLRVVRPVFP